MGKVCGFGLRFLHKERARLFSLLLSSEICRALGGGERPQRERERGRRRSDCVRARKRTLSLSFSLVRDFSRRSAFPRASRAGNDEGIKRERERKVSSRTRTTVKREKYGPDDFDVALVVSSSSARTFYNTSNDDFKSVLPPVCPVTFGAFLRPNVPAGHQRATAKIHLSNRDE